jgi:lipoate---protein ligase
VLEVGHRRPRDLAAAGAWTSLWHAGIRGDLGLAIDEAALAWVAATPDRAFLHLYRFDPPCVVIGYHQDPRAEADAAACRERGIAVHRRLTGGGSILMGPGQLGLALVLPRSAVSTAGGFGPVFEALSGGIIWALRRHGVESVLRPKNDLAVDGRKICGVGAYTDAAGMLLFHASTLVDFDDELMMEVLRIPEAKFRDKFVAQARQGMTTLREQTGRPVEVEELAADVEEGYRRTLGVSVERGGLDDRQWRDVEGIAAGRYRDPGWLHLGGRPGTEFTQVARKTAGGMVVVRCWREHDRVRELQLRGDFFAERGVVEAIEAALRGATAAEARDRVAAALPADHLWLVTADDLAALVAEALSTSGVEGGRGATACFFPRAGT